MDEAKIKKSIKNLSIFFVLFSLLIFIIAAFASTSISSTIHAAIDDQMENKIQQYKLNILRKVQADVQTLYALASFNEYSGDNLSADAFVHGLYNSSTQTNFSRIGYWGMDGSGVRVTLGGPIEYDVPVDSLNEHVQDTIKASWKGESSVSDIYYDSALSSYITVYSVPVYNDRVIVGALAASQRVNTFTEILKQTNSVSGEGIACIIDRYDRIISSTDTQSIGIDLTDSSYFSGEDMTSIKQYIKKNGSGSFELELGGEFYTTYIESLGINDAYIALVDTDGSVSGLLNQSLRMAQMVTVAFVVLTIICTVYGYRQIKRNNKRLLKLAYYDQLTGAYNTEKFYQMLHMAWTDIPEGFYIAGINIRQFKFINEMFGVQKSNQLLINISNTIRDNLDATEFFCRETADSFFLMLNEKDENIVRLRLNDILSDIRHTPILKKHTLSLYCGAAFSEDCPSGDDQQELLLTHMMFAVKRAKYDTKTDIFFYDLDVHKAEQLQSYIVSHMNQALNDNEFHLYLQPKVDLKTLKISGAEALVRWITTKGQTIYPDQFIPVFEENGFCINLDLYMVEQSCKFLRKCIDDGLQPVPISVNQTKLLFYEEDYVDKLCAITEMYDISPNLLTLEILEGLALGNADELNACIKQLRHRGFRISMDDFGSGYSSLNTLGNLEIDELKLDRAFLLAAAKDSSHRQRLIMGQIIILANKMNISTVAEGIETKEDENLLKELGCNYGQGYLYSRPISANEFYDKFCSKAE